MSWEDPEDESDEKLAEEIQLAASKSSEAKSKISKPAKQPNASKQPSSVSTAKIQKAKWQYFTKETKNPIGLKLAVIGPPKVGKTVTAASACLVEESIDTIMGAPIPSGTTVSMLDTEAAAHWLPKFYAEQFSKKKIRVKQIYKEHPDSKEIDPVQSFEVFWAELMDLSDLEEGTIVIDSLTDVYQWINSYLRLEILKMQPSKSGFQADVRPSDWYWRNDKWETMMKFIRKLKCNVIVTAKVKEEWDANSPDNSGKLRLHKTGGYKPQWHYVTPYWMDMIVLQDLRMIDGVVTRIARVQGSRAGLKVNYEIKKPNFRKICEEIGKIKPTLDW